MISLRIKKNEKSCKFGAYTLGRKRGDYETIQATLDTELPELVRHAARFAEPIEIQVAFRKKQKWQTAYTRRPTMAKTTLAFWSEGPENDESGIVIAGLTVSYAEIELAESRNEAIKMGLTTELCDLYEAQGGDYTAGSVRDWLDERTAEAEVLQAEIDMIDAPDERP